MSVACCVSGCLFSFDDLTNPSSQSLKLERVESGNCLAESDSFFRNYKVISPSLSLRALVSCRLMQFDDCLLGIWIARSTGKKQGVQRGRVREQELRRTCEREGETDRRRKRETTATDGKAAVRCCRLLCKAAAVVSLFSQTLVLISACSRDPLFTLLFHYSSRASCPSPLFPENSSIGLVFFSLSPSLVLLKPFTERRRRRMKEEPILQPHLIFGS